MAAWTSAQQQVIDSNAREIICSAAAGSGKTAVMVERIVRLLGEGREPDSFLVITFTNAAASEMKERIRRRLMEKKDNPNIRIALEQIDLMQISTIHSFCQQLIRNQFHVVDMDPDFQICDASLRSTLFQESFREACNQLYEEQDPLFALLRERFEIRKASEILQELESFLMSMPEPFKWMRKKTEQIPKTYDPEHPWFTSLRKMAQDHLFRSEILLSSMFSLFQESCALEAYRPFWKSDAELFHVKQREVQDEKAQRTPAVFGTLRTPKGLTVQESDWKDRYQKIRNRFKEEIKAIDACLLADPEKPLAEWQNIRESLQAVELLLSRTESVFQSRKKIRGVADFQDLEQYAVQILSDERARQEARSQWRYVFVDECQDVSNVQDRIIRLLQDPENHLFMVGDVKQSIYRFRLADPGQFMERIRDCRENPGMEKECICLQSNFRSRPEILETANLVFRSLMKESVSEISYGPEEELIPGRQTEGHEPVRVDRLEKGNRDISDLEALADYLQEQIADLRQTPYPGESRNYQYRDCVVLMPAVRPDGQELAELLSERGIPVFYDGEGDYYQLHEIQSVHHLLSWIEYPLQDLPLISVLQGPPFFFSDEELSIIRLKHPDKNIPFYEAFQQCADEKSDLGGKCAGVLQKGKEWQHWSETMRVCDLIWELYRDTGMYDILGVDPDGEIKRANLRMLAHQAAQAETRGILSLRDFLGYMRQQQAQGDQQSATLLGDQDDLVRVMTVHKSKGLQFPVVFCAGMDKEAVRTEGGEILFHAELGLCMNYREPAHRISRPTLAKEVFQWKKKREDMAERIRLLYVAMTRAQERLYMVTCRDMDPVWSMPEGEGRILAAKKYSDWWMPVFLQEERKNLSTGYTQAEKPYEIRVCEVIQQENVENASEIHSMTDWLESVISAPVVDELWKDSKQKEPSPTLVKRSVTSLIRSARQQLGTEEEDPGEETPEEKRRPDALAQRLNRMEMAEAPAFLREEGKISAAWRGTLTHRVLSLMNLGELRKGTPARDVLAAEKERMIREHIASPKEMDQVEDRKIIAFWESDIGKRMILAPEVHREWNFNLLIHRDQEMILQGVIDCAFREGDQWVILDYKTDRGKSPEQLAEEYAPQLMWYARAVEQLTGQQVKKAALYSLEREELIPIRVLQPSADPARGNS